MRRLPCSSNNNDTGRTIWPWACRELRSFPRDRSPSLQAGPEGSSQLAQPPGKSGAHRVHIVTWRSLGGICPRQPTPGFTLNARARPGKGMQIHARRSGEGARASAAPWPRKCPPLPAPGTSPAATTAAAGWVVSSPPTEDHRFPITQEDQSPSLTLNAVVNGRPFKFKSRSEPTPLAPPTSSLIGVEARRLPRLHRDWCVFSFGPPPPRARKRSMGRRAEVGTRRGLARKLWPWFPWRWRGGGTRGWPCSVLQPPLAAVGGGGGEPRGGFWGAAGPARGSASSATRCRTS